MTSRRKWPRSVETFMAALTPEEAVRWKAFRVALTSPETDLKAVEADFVVWAEPIVRRLGGGSVGAVWNPFKVRYSPEQPTEVQPLAELADRFPYPLGLKLSEVVRASRRRAEGEPEPQFAFEICATFGVLLRFAALVVIRGYVDAGSRDAELNRYIVATLRRPSDGSWLEISRRLAGDAGHVPMVRVIRDALAFEPRLPPAMRSRLRGTRKTSAALQELVEVRNTLMHGVVPAAEALDGAEALLELVIRGFEGLGDYLLYVRHEGRVWEFEGAAPRLVAGWEALPEGEPCLVRRVGDEAPLSLSPLLRFRAGVPGGSPVATSDHFDPAWEGEGFAVEFDELFFLNAGSKEELRYIGFGSSSVLDGRTLQSYEDFKAFLARIPTPAVVPNDRIDFTNLAAFHADLFVGRAAVLDELHTFVRERRAPYLVLPALAGLGTSAIMAREWE